ncbi:hypothetical protein ACLKMH_12295 [Psychromonas sp. KJ10-10]|uniref:hypothetical protein n=1 Tax=Psychromonas sp. KJ10-10 TaxID=3391823 RepID=UPI0039B4A948
MNKTHFVLGGDLKKSLTEGYTLDFKKIFKDAFAITRSNYMPLIIACIFTVAIVSVIFTLNFEAFLGLSETKQLIVNLIFSSFVVTPLVTGLHMMGINHAVGLKSRSIDLFIYFNIILKLALASLIMNIIILASNVALTEVLGNIGQNLSYIVMIYFNVVFSMVYPLIAEKKFTPALSIKLSFKLINKNLLQFTLLFVFLTLLAVISILPSGLGLFLFVPFYFNVMGIVYRQICGVGVVATEIVKKDDDSDNDDSNNGSNDDDKHDAGFEA